MQQKIALCQFVINFQGQFVFEPALDTFLFHITNISTIKFVRRRHSSDKDTVTPYQRIEVWEQLSLHLR